MAGVDIDPHVETRLATLIESIRSLSTITANHDVLLTKLIDDHEQRIRHLEKCSIASANIPDIESRVRNLDNWRWYAVGIAVGVSLFLSAILTILITKAVF